VLDIVFKLADDRGLLLLDLDDLRALLAWSPASARTSPPRMDWSARSRSARSSARCCAWSRKAARCSSASPRWNCRPDAHHPDGRGVIGILPPTS
jgi:hypothetical protein